MATPVMKQISRIGADAAPAAIAPPSSMRPFAEDTAGAGYFASDHHHRYVAAAIFRELAKGRWFVLLCGEHSADAELVERFLNEEGKERYRATLLHCQAETDFGAIVRAYNRRLGLRQEAGSDGLWTLLSHLMAEVRKGVRRILVLDNADALEPTCFDELLRFTRLDEPHVMPVVLLGDPGFADRLASPAYGFLNSAIAGRVGFDRLEPEEVGAFLYYQLNAAGADAAAFFPPEVISVIAATSGGSVAAVNRMAREVLEKARREAERVALPPPSPAADPIDDVVLEIEDPEEEAQEPEESGEPEEPKDLAAPLALPPPRPSAKPAPPPRRLPTLRRLPVPFALGVYVLAASLSGLGLLYLLAPRASDTSTIASASATKSPAIPIVAAEQKPADAVVPIAPEAAPHDAAAQAAAVEPAAGPPPVPPDAAAPPDSTVAPSATAAATPAAPEPPATAASETPAPKLPDAAIASAAPANSKAQPAAPLPAPPPAKPETEPAAAPEAPALSVAAAEPAARAPTLPAPVAPPAPVATAPVASAAPVPAAPDVSASAPASARSPSAAKPEPPAAAPSASPDTSVAALEPARPLLSPEAKAKPAQSPELALLVQRGDELLKSGDIISARQFYLRAAEAGDAAAQCGLGKSYDPLFLRRLGTRGVAGDAATAAHWYSLAAAAGSDEAAARLARLGGGDSQRSASGKSTSSKR